MPKPIEIGSLWWDKERHQRVTISDAPPVMQRVHFVFNDGTRRDCPEAWFRARFEWVARNYWVDDDPPESASG